MSSYLILSGTFAKSRRTIMGFLVSVYTSVRPYSWNNSALAGQIFMKLYI